MATFRRSILGAFTKPGASGEVFFEPNGVKGTNDFFDEMVLVFNDSATRDPLYGKFQVPQNYVGSAKFIISWTSTATSGDVEWDFDYRCVAAGESLDQATAQQSLNQNDTAPGTTDLMQVAELTPTAGNFTAGDICQFILYRDGTDAGDTISAAVTVSDVSFEWADA